MNISSNNWSLSIDLNGGRIRELSYKGIKVLGTYHRIDGKIGNTHLCVPSFDKEGIEKYNLPFHGLVRNGAWNVERRTGNEMRITTTTLATDSYPASLKVEQTFTLGDTFKHDIFVYHLSGEPVPVNSGVHYYWDTPNGWEKTTVNSRQSAEQIKNNGYIDLQEKNIIRFPHATYQVTSDGFHNAVLWTSFKIDEKGKRQYGRDFCCIEPVIGWSGYFGSEKSIVRKGETKSFSLEVSAGERT